MIYKRNYQKWEYTLKLYTDWVANSHLRKFFSKEIKIKNFSLWWVTNICSKDNIVRNRWYYDLKDCLINKKKIKFNQLTFYSTFFLKFLKNLLTHFFWFSIIKILSYSRYKNLKKSNCFHSLNYNFFKKGDTTNDMFWGKAPYSKYANDNLYIVNIIKKKHFILNLFNKKRLKKNIPYIVADEFLSVFDVIYVYYKTITNFYKLLFFINKNKNLFFINGTNCEKVLKPFLLMSFAGEIQNSLFNAISIKNFLKSNKEIKLFITYVGFDPGSRAVYYFVKDLENPPKVISVQHGSANKNIMYFVHKKNEFTKNKLLEGQYYSPSPDFYLTMGEKLNKMLNNYFPNKKKIIGSLHYDFNQLKKKNKSTKTKKILLKNKEKKIILICPSTGDELEILYYLKHSVNFNSRFILSPHPTFENSLLKKYLYELKKNCELEVYKNVSTKELLSISDLVICGFSSVAYEALILGVKTVRIFDVSNPQIFDKNDKITVVKNPYHLKKILDKKSYSKIPSAIIKRLVSQNFYKLDNKANNRFWSFIDTIN